MTDAKPWSRLWVTAGDGCNRCGGVGASHNKKRLLYAGESPPALHDIPRKVIYVAVKIREIDPRHQGSRLTRGLKQFPRAICNLQQSSGTGWGMAGIRVPWNPFRPASDQIERSHQRTERVARGISLSRLCALDAFIEQSVAPLRIGSRLSFLTKIARWAKPAGAWSE